MAIFKKLLLYLRRQIHIRRLMYSQEEPDTTLLIHIEYSEPIRMKALGDALTACNRLYAQFIKDNKITTQGSIAIKQIEHNCIDILACIVAVEGVLKVLDKANTVMRFGEYLKKIFDYFVKDKGEEPELTLSQAKSVKNLITTIKDDKQGVVETSVLIDGDPSLQAHRCTIHNDEVQQAITKLDERIKQRKARGERIKPMFSHYLMIIRKDPLPDSTAILAYPFQKGPDFEEQAVFQNDKTKQKALDLLSNSPECIISVNMNATFDENDMGVYQITKIHDGSSFYRKK